MKLEAWIQQLFSFFLIQWHLYLVAVVQLLSCVQLLVTPWVVARQAPPSPAISWSLLKFMSIESVILSNHLILCCPLLLVLTVFPSTRVLSSELALCIRWPKDWSFSFSIKLPMNIQGLFPLRLAGMISLQSKGLSRVYSSITIWSHQFFGAQLPLWSNSHIHNYWKKHSFDCMDLCQQSDVSDF